MNIIGITGRVATDIEQRATPSGALVATFSVAVKRPYSKETDFFDVVAWRQTAEYVCKYASKGSMIAVNGYLTRRQYDGKDGVKRSVYEIVAEEINVLEGRKQQEPAQTPKSEVEAFLSHFRDDPVELNDPDLPF